jgi:hypothetical protein
MKSFLKNFYILLVIIFLQTPCFGLTLKEKLTAGEVGDFIVTEQNQIISLLFIRDKEDNVIVFEEVSAPCSHIKAEKKDWRRWIREGAPGHLSWVSFTIDLNKGKLLKAYSFNQAAWIESQSESLLAKLLTLPLIPLGEGERKKIGPPPLEETDRRAIWNPPVTYEGKKIAKASCEPWKTVFPEDESELSGKRIDLYFSKHLAHFPFPIWLQINGELGSFTIRAIDAGKAISSPKPIPN